MAKRNKKSMTATHKQPVNNAPRLPFVDAAQPASSSGPVRVRMMVSPQQAEEWLKKNVRNRGFREGWSSRIARDLEAGRWEYNGDAIRFAPNGDLTDGQHRLSACVASGKPLDTDVIFNLESRLCDIGATRTAADMAALRGVKNSARASALAKLVIIHRRYGIARMNSTNIHPTKTEVTIETEQNPELQNALVPALKRKLVAPSVADFCYYVFREQNAERAAQFMTDVLTGENLPKDNPAFLLRGRIINNNRDAKGKLSHLYLIALFFVAWKYYRDGKPLRCLKWNTGDEFPSIQQERTA